MGRTKASNLLREAVVAITLVAPQLAQADEGGVSFWLPGLFGSLAAVPQQQPGWAFATFYYHTSVSAGGDVALAREFEIGRIPAGLSATLNANLNATADLGVIAPSYTFATPVLGGQASVGISNGALTFSYQEPAVAVPV